MLDSVRCRPSRSVAPPLDKGTPGESRGGKATGPRCPPTRPRTGTLQQWGEYRPATANLRKTCLKPEYASLYPEVPPNIWLGAAGVAAQVAARLRRSAGSNYWATEASAAG